jgi:hypothetical protein
MQISSNQLKKKKREETSRTDTNKEDNNQDSLYNLDDNNNCNDNLMSTKIRYQNTGK